MTARTRSRTELSPLHIFAFAVAVSAGLIAVLVPVLPGEVPLSVGDRAFKTFTVDGDVIIEEGRVITNAGLNRLQAEGLLDNRTSFGDALAAIVVAVLSGAMLGLYLRIFQPREVNSVRRLILLGLLVVLWVASAKIILSLALPDSDGLHLAYILPVAAVPMLLASLMDDGLALVVAGLLAVLATFSGYYMPDARFAPSTLVLEPLQMTAAFLLSSLAGVYAIKRAERVNHYAGAGMIVGGVVFVVLFTFWLLNPAREPVDLFWMLVASGLGGVAAAVIAVGGTAVLGVMFGITTRIQLMELAQLSHPLLRDLQEKAPGTFHHSVIVGNLAERAADLIGADSLLVRVGCYFHDIGKIAKPSFYIENQMEAGNPHDKLKPHVSARMVSEHVTLGWEMTGKYRLPPRVRAFIPEHHGTRLVTYFYRKAAAEDPTIDPEKFRYPGPKPQSRETAMVMLADSVEAVVRSSQDRSHEKIDELVDGVIAERVAEGQLDDTDLTLRDLKTIAESFKATLRGIYHSRIEYPAPTSAETQAAGAQTGVAYLKPPSEPMEAPPVEVEPRR